MRPVSIAGFAQLPQVLRDTSFDEAEQVQRVTAAARADAGLQRSDVGFTCSGSNDYVMGRPFSFVSALDGLGAWPPIRESHVETDGAWALYEAWVRLQHGDVDVALVYAFGKSSLGPVATVQTLMLDPYFLAPLGIDPLSMAALQALPPAWRAELSLLIGDFNCGIPLLDSQTRTFPCTAWFQRLLAQGWVDAWRRRHPQEREYSWFSASRGNGFRYDHALASSPLDARIRSVRYAQELRAAGLSDHAGLVIELG